jgi:hypothetical protein
MTLGGGGCSCVGAVVLRVRGASERSERWGCSCVGAVVLRVRWASERSERWGAWGVWGDDWLVISRWPAGGNLPSAMGVRLRTFDVSNVGCRRSLVGLGWRGVWCVITCC